MSATLPMQNDTHDKTASPPAQQHLQKRYKTAVDRTPSPLQVSTATGGKKRCNAATAAADTELKRPPVKQKRCGSTSAYYFQRQEWATAAAGELDSHAWSYTIM